MKTLNALISWQINIYGVLVGVKLVTGKRYFLWDAIPNFS